MVQLLAWAAEKDSRGLWHRAKPDPHVQHLLGSSRLWKEQLSTPIGQALMARGSSMPGALVIFFFLIALTAPQSPEGKHRSKSLLPGYLPWGP